MKKITIENFKAFSNKLEISFPNSENLLIYGENGAGKSSIFEAVKYFFNKDKLEKQASIDQTIPANQVTFKNKSFKNKISGNDINLRINDIEVDDYYTDATKKAQFQDYNVSFLSFKLFKNITFGKIKDMIDETAFSDTHLFDWITDLANLKQKLNDNLKYFTTSIDIDFVYGSVFSGVTPKADEKIILIKEGTIRIDENYDTFFNEAKLNVILVLLYLSYFEVITEGKSCKRILVLDDIITSLDTANRTFFVRFLNEKFSNADDQLIILTHNTNFFNIIHKTTSNYNSLSTKSWLSFNLYQVSGNHICKEKTSIKILNEELKKNFVAKINNNQTALIDGHKLRQLSENIIFELGELLEISNIEAAKNLIYNFQKRSSIYLKHVANSNRSASWKYTMKNIYDLLDELKGMINNSHASTFKTDLLDKIKEYEISQSEIDKIHKLMSELKLYQNVTLHPLAHSTGVTISDVPVAEIEASVLLLKHLCELTQNLKSSLITS